MKSITAFALVSLILTVTPGRITCWCCAAHCGEEDTPGPG